MKRESFIRTVICAAFIGFIFCLGAQTARAQNVQPFVDCLERERDSNGALTNNYIAYFGYINYGDTAYIPLNTAGNFMTPVKPPGQPENFLPGINHRAVAVRLDLSARETWRLTIYSATASFLGPEGICGSEGANARLMTYQGKLNDGNQAANGVYDLQFQLFNAQTGGAARTTKIVLENVPVANGIFTVQLDLGANSIIAAGSPNQPLNPSILSGENGFFEIGVRPGTSLDDFTVLSPRQPLTAVPFAMRANTADNAVRATIADTGRSGFQVVGDAFIRVYPFFTPSSSGNLTVEKNLTVNGTINGTATNATNATNVSGGFVQLPLTTGAPPATECDAASEYGRQKVDASNLRLYICTAAGWKSTALQ